jgi:hypothetical protein
VARSMLDFEVVLLLNGGLPTGGGVSDRAPSEPGRRRRAFGGTLRPSSRRRDPFMRRFLAWVPRRTTRPRTATMRHWRLLPGYKSDWARRRRLSLERLRPVCGVKNRRGEARPHPAGQRANPPPKPATETIRGSMSDDWNNVAANQTVNPLWQRFVRLSSIAIRMQLLCPSRPPSSSANEFGQSRAAG